MNNKIRITKEFKFEMAHALFGYDGLCKNVHGHSYKLSVTLIGNPISDEENEKFGMVMDFSEIKEIVTKTVIEPFDHSTVLNIDSPHNKLAEAMKSLEHKVKPVNYPPTTEMIVLDFAEKIKEQLPSDVKLHHLMLRETETCYAEWFASDQKD